MYVCVHVCVYVRSYFNLYNSVYTYFLPLSLSLSLSLSLLYTQSKLQQQLAGEDSEAEEGRGPCLCWGSGCHAGRSAAGGQGVVIARDLEYPDPLSTRSMREQRRAINPHLRIKAGSCLRSLSVA